MRKRHTDHLFVRLPTITNVYVWIGVCFLALAVGVALIGHRLRYGMICLRSLFLDLYADISTGFLGIAVTVLVIDSITRRSAIQTEKKSLILQMGSPDNSHAVEAVRLLRARGWLSTALRKAYLVEANLESAALQRASLRWADLSRANLRRANFYRADLENAYLIEADLEGAVLLGANMRFGKFFRANLRGVQLSGADLSGANLMDAKLESSQVDGVILSTGTILPDGTKWTSSKSLVPFTQSA